MIPRMVDEPMSIISSQKLSCAAGQWYFVRMRWMTRSDAVVMVAESSVYLDAILAGCVCHGGQEDVMCGLCGVVVEEGWRCYKLSRIRIRFLCECELIGVVVGCGVLCEVELRGTDQHSSIVSYGDGVAQANLLSSSSIPNSKP